MRGGFVCALLTAALVLSGCGGAGGGGGGGGPAAPPAAEAPAVGQAWFGSGFEEGTLRLQGRTTTIAQGSPVVVIGRLISPRDPSEVVVQIQRAGSEVARIPVPDGPPSDIMGVDLTPQNLGPGTYLVNFVASNRRTLASGTLIVTS